MAPSYTAYTNGTSGWMNCSTTAATTTNISWVKSSNAYAISFDDFLEDTRKIRAGKQEIELPDGAKLLVDDLGNYRIEDKDARVTYRANRIREFSPYLNASDMLAKFVEYAGQVGVKQNEVLGLPIGLFVNWLVLEAAERDGDPIPTDIAPVPQQLRAIVKPKCLKCGRFIKRLHCQHRFPFCNVEHAAAYVERLRPAPKLIAANVAAGCP